MNLVIVESPTKARTLSHFLGTPYQIMASMGHVRDLPKKKLGVDVKKNFKPEYVLIPAKIEVVDKLKGAAKKAREVILATDPDREGEAIAYHVVKILRNSEIKKLREKDKKIKPSISQYLNFSISRITFHEITKSAIEEALKNPGQINLQLVQAQQARRILDRLVGYKLSPLLWSKVRRGLSAGRVQSVALRFIVEREREIEKFKGQEYWTIETKLKAQSSKLKTEEFAAQLYAKDGEKYETIKTLQLFAGPYKYQISNIKYQKEAEEISQDLKRQDFIVEKVEEKEVLRQPPPPFITSTLQQSANRAFGFSAKRTMQIAQKLYEEGLITYHRTDSYNLANQAVKNIRNFVKSKWGEDYLPDQPRVYKTRSKVAQEAHEAIRPTDIRLATGPAAACLANSFTPGESHRATPGVVPWRGTPKFGKDEERLYDLIWKRTLATQMAAARFSQSSADIKAGPYILRTTGLRTLFDGFLKLYPQRLKEKLLPKLLQGEKLKLLEILPNQQFTTPPPRYNEASLVKILESKGIGRPSTYAPIISVLGARAYVERREGVFWPTPVGQAVNDFLVANFADIVDIPFTAELEEDLDAIARGEKKWLPILKQFFAPFERKLNIVYKNSSRVKIEAEKTGRQCPKCKKGEVVIRTGKFGKFLSCSRFPKCEWKADYVEKLPKVKCPQCGAAVVLRRTKKGKQFFGCESWPKCTWASWRKPSPSS